MPTMRSVYEDYYPQLIKSLPMNDAVFLAELFVKQCLSGDTLKAITTKATNVEKASFFLDHIIKPAFEDDGSNPVFLDLLNLMMNTESMPLAKEIKSKLAVTESTEATGKSILPQVKHKSIKATSISPQVKNKPNTEVPTMRSVYMEYYPKLIKFLPIEAPFFRRDLVVKLCLPGDTMESIEAKATRFERASFFLDHIITPAFEDDGSNPMFLDLLNLMMNTESMPLAKEIKSKLAITESTEATSTSILPQVKYKSTKATSIVPQVKNKPNTKVPTMRSVYMEYYTKLIEVLPMSKPLFIAELYAKDFLPGDTKEAIAAIETRAKKATFFLNHIITPVFMDDGSNPVFSKLLNLMMNTDNDALTSLAKEIKGKI